MEILYPRGAGRHPKMIVIDEFWYETGIEDFCKWMLRDQLKKPMNLSEKKKEYLPELKTSTRVIDHIELKDQFTLEEMMYMHRDSIAGKMIESIRKDCE